jgi:hypothetical protein
MIAMKLTIELDIGLPFLLRAALPQLVTDRETKTHRRGRSKRSYGHAGAAPRSRKRNPTGTLAALSRPFGSALLRACRLPLMASGLAIA